MIKQRKFLRPYLVGRENITLYSPCFGDLTDPHNASLCSEFIVVTTSEGQKTFNLIEVNEAGVGNIYPTRELFAKYPFDPITAWDEWSVENLPKTWETLIQVGRACPMIADTSYPASTKEERSAVALLKILQLINKFFGGVPSLEEWDDNCCEPDVDCAGGKYIGWEDELSDKRSPIAFRSADFADEFLSYESNVQLLRDYYMISED